MPIFALLFIISGTALSTIGVLGPAFLIDIQGLAGLLLHGSTKSEYTTLQVTYDILDKACSQATKNLLMTKWPQGQTFLMGTNFQFHLDLLYKMFWYP